MDSYLEKLVATKAHYPFLRWRKSGLPQYTDESCARCAAVFDRLIANLGKVGELGPEEAKIELFKEAVEAFNSLSEEDESLIETGEREDLCEMCNVVVLAAGIDPKLYGHGEGPASEWRTW